ncbi:MAG: 4Fe-4S binding protein [Lachnospiraceae bacterium]
MEVSRKRKAKKIAVVFCQGGNNVKRNIAGGELTGDCAQVSEQYPEGVLECQQGCLGQGSCVSACKFNAIQINISGSASVDSHLCKGCVQCVKACPRGLIQMISPESTIMPLCSNQDKGGIAKNVCTVSCIACGICERNCPVGAVSIIENRAVIDQELCIACGMCAVKCPRHVIMDADGIFTAG